MQSIIYLLEKEHLLKQAAFWQEVKVVCCLLTPFSLKTRVAEREIDFDSDFPSLQCRRILGGRKLVNRIATMKPPSLIL